jgi:hypothetical protein
LFIPQTIEAVTMESHGGMILTKENRRIGENLSQCQFFHNKSHMVRLGGAVVSVLATGPKGSKPGQGDGFLRAIKICNTPSSRMGSKAGRSHVVRFYCM